MTPRSRRDRDQNSRRDRDQTSRRDRAEIAPGTASCSSPHSGLPYRVEGPTGPSARTVRAPRCVRSSIGIGHQGLLQCGMGARGAEPRRGSLFFRHHAHLRHLLVQGLARRRLDAARVAQRGPCVAVAADGELFRLGLSREVGTPVNAIERVRSPTHARARHAGAHTRTRPEARPSIPPPSPAHIVSLERRLAGLQHRNRCVIRDGKGRGPQRQGQHGTGAPHACTSLFGKCRVRVRSENPATPMWIFSRFFRELSRDRARSREVARDRVSGPCCRRPIVGRSHLGLISADRTRGPPGPPRARARSNAAARGSWQASS